MHFIFQISVLLPVAKCVLCYASGLDMSWLRPFVSLYISIVLESSVNRNSFKVPLKILNIQEIFNGLEQGRKVHYKLYLLSKSLIKTYPSENLGKKKCDFSMGSSIARNH